jgi:hypothetical protein
LEELDSDVLIASGRAIRNVDIVADVLALL